MTFLSNINDNCHLASLYITIKTRFGIFRNRSKNRRELIPTDTETTNGRALLGLTLMNSNLFNCSWFYTVLGWNRWNELLEIF